MKYLLVCVLSSIFVFYVTLPIHNALAVNTSVINIPFVQYQIFSFVRILLSLVLTAFVIMKYFRN
jgi:hypothetical protein